MQNILAVTACLKRCSIAIMHEGALYEVNENVDAAENLVFLADELMKSNSIEDIDEIITTSGPGSFTGIRVAQSFVKALAFAKKIPAFCVDYFDVITSMSTPSPNKTILIKSDKDQVYFCKIKSGRRQNIGVASYADIVKMIDQDELVVGDAVKEILLQNPRREYNVRCEYIDEFRNAKHLIKFADSNLKNPNIRPLYINASSEQRPIRAAH